MYRTQNLHTRFDKYSIYSSFSTYNLRHQKRYKGKTTPVKRFLCQVSTVVHCFVLFTDFFLTNLPRFSLLTFTNSWNLCYFLSMYQKCTVGTETEAFQMVEILKNDSSDSDDQAKPPKTKKSLFATLIKRKESPKVRKVEMDFDSDSVSEQEVAQYQISAETRRPLIKYPKIKRYNFFKRIIKRSNSVRFNPRKCPEDCEKKTFKALTLKVPTTYMPKCNVKLINGINELQAILHSLHHSEEHMVQLLKKYIEDKNVEKQLFEATFDYFAHQFDSKTQAIALTDRIWSQHLELNKMQDYNLQKRLNYLVQTNRNLESQVETLNRTCEKLAARSNIYPKRFLHMRSFGKVYARQLIDNNRKLQKKIQVLTNVISDFEEEFEKMQHQKLALEEEKRSAKMEIYQLEGLLDKLRNDGEVEKSALLVQMSRGSAIVNEGVDAARLIFKDLQEFELQLRDLGVKVNWPCFQSQDACLPDVVYQVRTWVAELFLTVSAGYKRAAKDVAKLRITNSRLQENLQKSTSELDNLSKKLDKIPEVDSESQSKSLKLEQENFTLKLQLDHSTQENKLLKEEVEFMKTKLGELKSERVDELVLTVSQMCPGDLSKQFHSVEDKMDFLRARYSEMVSGRNQLFDRSANLEEELQSLQQAYQQDLATLQDGLTVLSAENETLKKQLANEHQTVSSLQNERVKYLKEKNILKTIFQHLKSEVQRIQQLEGAVADMSKETTRLSLVAEFNKQLGEHLKSEVEVRENTIVELKQSLEKLSHIQLDSDKEKMTLCAQLSEVSSVKEKLTDCLELELKKNVKLDESRKKLECNTKSQLKVYEEMQKNERAALKELLRDFKNMVKQRDCLVHHQEENRKKLREFEKRYEDLRTLYDDTVKEKDGKEEEIRRIVEKMSCMEEQHKLEVEKCNETIAKFEKSNRKLERHLSHLRNEKFEVETNNSFLKIGFEKLQNERNEAREQELDFENKIKEKETECAALESELNTYKGEVQVLNHENGKLSLELGYLKKLYEKQISELKETISGYCSKEAVYMDMQTAVLNKEQQINELTKSLVEKEGELKRVEQQCDYLRKQTEDQNKIMINYENQLVMLQDIEVSKFKVEQELTYFEAEYKRVLADLERVKKENENLNVEINALIINNEKEKECYKQQTREIISEYGEQKSNIEKEIDSISDQLRSVTESLHSEKIRFEELNKSHEELKLKYIQMREHLNSEVAAHKEVRRKLQNMDGYMAAIATERDNLQRQVQLLLLQVSEEKEASNQLLTDTKNVHLILEQGKEQYESLLSKNSALQKELNEVKLQLEDVMNSRDLPPKELDEIALKLEEKKSEMRAAKETIGCLKEEMKDSQKQVFELKEEVFRLQQHVTNMEFKNCELTLQLHETQAKLETEQNLYKDLKSVKTPEQTPTPTSPLAPSEFGDLYY